ncbi:MAG: type IV secretory system conjugative DNA transfer family protein, partial [Pseudomonadota bacterium]
TEIFGRFFIALLAQAAQERATIPPGERTPTIVYIDEAQDYFDANNGLILAQARKYNIGMVMAHQYLGQLENKLQEGFEANTSIKLAGGVSARDARTLAGQMGCDAETILRQPKGSFATFVRGLTEKAIPVRFPFFALEDLPRVSREEQDAVRAQSRARYAEPLRPSEKNPAQEPEDDVKPERHPTPQEERDEGTDGTKGEASEPLAADEAQPTTAEHHLSKADASERDETQKGGKPIGTSDSW